MEILKNFGIGRGMVGWEANGILKKNLEKSEE